MEQASLTRAVAHFKDNDYDSAEKHCVALIKAKRNLPDALNLLGIIKGRHRNDKSGIELLRRAVSLEKDRAEFHHNLATLHGQFGDTAASETHYLRAIELNPSYGEAWQGLADIRRLDRDDPLIEQLERLADRSEFPDEKRCYLNFALARFLDRAEDHDAAFERYLVANPLKGAKFDWPAHDKLVAETMDVFSASAVAPGVGSSSVRPVFVVGMPRTGTSLVEQILASHPEVFGAGERRDVTAIAGTLKQHHPQGAAYPACVPEIAPNVFRGFAQSYLRQVAAADPAAVRIVDKHPLNFRFLGLIERLFPHARVIHCRRDPLDACISCFFQNFVSGQEYAFDLTDLGRYHRSYQQMMTFWKETSRLAILDVDYEDLAANPEDVSKAMLNFVGLPWDDACARPWETDRPVATASRFQVRAPVHTGSVERWRRYDRHLEPLRRALAGET